MAVSRVILVSTKFSRAFSLIELAVVIGILGLLFGLGISIIPAHFQSNLNERAQRIKHLIESSRLHSLHENQFLTIGIMERNQQLQIVACLLQKQGNSDEFQAVLLQRPIDIPANLVCEIAPSEVLHVTWHDSKSTLKGFRINRFQKIISLNPCECIVIQLQDKNKSQVIKISTQTTEVEITKS